MFIKRWNEVGQGLETCECTAQKVAVSREDALKMIHFLITQVDKQKGIIYTIGNGGSSAIASHFTTDLLRTLSISSTTFSDGSLLTCFANDCGYEHVYSTPLKRNIRERDLLIAISSSGQSLNIVNAVKVAKEAKVPVITLSGFSKDNPLRVLGDLNIWVDSSDYGIVEVAHFSLLHTVIDTYSKVAEPSHSLKTEVC